MECRSRKAKKQFLTRADAERQVQNAKKSGVHLYAYQCSCKYWHLATIKKTAANPAEITNAEWRHIKNRVADLGRQIANGDRRWLEQELRRIAKLVDADRLWLAEEAERSRVEADRLRDLADSIRLANEMVETFA